MRRSRKGLLSLLLKYYIRYIKAIVRIWGDFKISICQ